MKKILVSALALGGVLVGSVAQAGSSDDVATRLAALEKENAAIRAENAALRQNKTLRETNAALKSSAAVTPLQASASAKRSDPFAAYAADLPAAYKARPLEEKGQFRVWGEGGAIWTGGDPVSSAYAPGAGGGILGLTGFGTAGVFELKPKLGWEAAAGFDYRFAGSPWHASGQFRYGEGGKTSGSAASSSFLDLSGLGGLGAAGAFAAANDRITADYNEAHWIADLAVGKDIFGNGAEAMQLKGGLRISEFAGTTNLAQSSFTAVNFGGPLLAGPGGIPISTISQTTTIGTRIRSSFLGAGPLVGIEGSIPLAAGWAFDYSGDAAVLFGTQKTATSTATNVVVDPAIIAALAGGVGSSSAATTTERFATVLSADIQVGLAYWLTPNLKLGVNYRLDAMINTQNQSSTAVTNQTPDRYTHGPHVRLSATF